MEDASYTEVIMTLTDESTDSDHQVNFSEAVEK